jgi:hypothetical protein
MSATPILNHRDLGLTLAQFSQFTDAEIIALSNARLTAELAAGREQLDRILDEEPETPEERAESEAEYAQQVAREQREEAERE